MKTATLRVYPIFGTRADYCADVLYRGRRLARFTKQNLENWEPQAQGVTNRARDWAAANGFSHVKLTHG